MANYCKRCDTTLEEDNSLSEWEEKAQAEGLCLACWQDDQPEEES